MTCLTLCERINEQLHLASHISTYISIHVSIEMSLLDGKIKLLPHLNQFSQPVPFAADPNNPSCSRDVTGKYRTLKRRKIQVSKQKNAQRFYDIVKAMSIKRYHLAPPYERKNKIDMNQRPKNRIG